MFLSEELCETTTMLFKGTQNKDLPLLSKSMDFSCFLSEMLCGHWAGLCNLPLQERGHCIVITVIHNTQRSITHKELRVTEEQREVHSSSLGLNC